MQGRKRKRAKTPRKPKRRDWRVIDSICQDEQELLGGHRRHRAGGGWLVRKKPLPR